jgi:hypothetical protein
MAPTELSMQVYLHETQWCRQPDSRAGRRRQADVTVKADREQCSKHKVVSISACAPPNAGALDAPNAGGGADDPNRDPPVDAPKGAEVPAGFGANALPKPPAFDKIIGCEYVCALCAFVCVRVHVCVCACVCVCVHDSQHTCPRVNTSA